MEGSSSTLQTKPVLGSSNMDGASSLGTGKQGLTKNVTGGVSVILPAISPRGSGSSIPRLGRRSEPCDKKPQQRPPTSEAQNVRASPTEGISSNTTLRYVVQMGNNSMLVRSIMKQRRCWMPAPGDPRHSATTVEYDKKTCKPIQIGICRPNATVHFLWTQFVIRDYYAAMMQMKGAAVMRNSEGKLEVKMVGDAVGPMIHNHFEGNAALCTKAGFCESWVEMFKAENKDPFDSFPLTFSIRTDQDESFKEFEEAFDTLAKEDNQKVWIVKPGDYSNRGSGIRIYDNKQEIKERILSKERMWVVQKYIERPLLVRRRKFDIRAYCLVDFDLKAFYYEDAYLRTTSEEWNLLQLGNKLAHLNNDAIQNHGQNYGKYEVANKKSLKEFQKYLQSCGYNVSVEEDIMVQIKDRMHDAIMGVYKRLNPNNLSCFEIYGFDFMIDNEFNVWIIEVNTNPCLDQCNNHLSRLLPAMLDDAFTHTIDKIFPPKTNSTEKLEPQESKWTLIFDPATDDGRVLSPGRLLSESLPGHEAILKGPLDPFRDGKKALTNDNNGREACNGPKHHFDKTLKKNSPPVITEKSEAIPIKSRGLMEPTHRSSNKEMVARSTERSTRRQESIHKTREKGSLRGVSLEKGPRSSIVGTQSTGLRSPSHRSIEKEQATGLQKLETGGGSPSQKLLDKGNRNDDLSTRPSNSFKSDIVTGRSPSHKSLEKNYRGSPNPDGIHLLQKELKLRSVTPPLTASVHDHSFPVSRGATHRSKSVEKGVRSKVDDPGPLGVPLEAAGIDKRNDGKRLDRRTDSGTVFVDGSDLADRSDKKNGEVPRITLGREETASPDQRKGDDTKTTGRLIAGRVSHNIPLRESKDIERNVQDLIINGSGTPLF